MNLTGIADEASPDLARQLDAHEELGWKSIELRSVDGRNIGALDDRAFDGPSAGMDARGIYLSYGRKAQALLASIVEGRQP